MKLQRKKLLIETDAQRTRKALLRVYQHRYSGEVFIVKDPQIPLSEVAPLQEEVQQLLAPDPEPEPSDPSDPSDISDSEDNVILPAKGSTVTLAAFPTNSGLNETTWIYEQGGSIGFTNEGEAKITLPLVKYNTDISTAATP